MMVCFFPDFCCSLSDVLTEISPESMLRPVLFVVQVMNDISKQDYVHNKQISQCTKIRFCINHK